MRSSVHDLLRHDPADGWCLLHTMPREPRGIDPGLGFRHTPQNRVVIWRDLIVAPPARLDIQLGLREPRKALHPHSDRLLKPVPIHTFAKAWRLIQIGAPKQDTLPLAAQVEPA